MKYTILQLDIYNIDVMKDEKLFVSWDDLNKYSKFDISQYKKVYEDEVTEMTDLFYMLESIFRKFNHRYPSDFYGHSLSVSDVVNVDGINYYCDIYGWVNTETGKAI